MNVVNPNDTIHEISIVPRYDLGDGFALLTLYNEVTQESSEPGFNYSGVNGDWRVFITFTFNEGDRYQIKITENNGVAYRGKIFATTQGTQEYNPTANAYYY